MPNPNKEEQGITHFGPPRPPLPPAPASAAAAAAAPPASAPAANDNYNSNDEAARALFNITRMGSNSTNQSGTSNNVPSSTTSAGMTNMHPLDLHHPYENDNADGRVGSGILDDPGNNHDNDYHDDDDDDNDEAAIRYYDPSRHAPHRRERMTHARTFRRVQRVSRHAARTTKQQLWDSNAASIGVALSAVDQWEGAYNALRGLLVASVHSARGLYGTAKEGAEQLEHGLLIPVRDWIILPAFSGLERAVGETVGFFQSNAAQQVFGQSVQLAATVPWIGETVLAPGLHLTAAVAQQSWHVIQYPIPSRQQVQESVDFALTGTKWALSVTAREISLYVKRADANITRTLSHTQWKVLGSGPYATLDKLNKSDVMDHFCERYLNLNDNAVARYELAAHLRRHNRPLYHDLVVSGVLRERGRDVTADDEWLNTTCPSYRSLEEPFFIPTTTVEQQNHNDNDSKKPNNQGEEKVAALWFRLPNVNGKRPGKDVPWICFPRKEIKALEKRYLQILRQGQGHVVVDNNNADAGAAGSESTTLQVAAEGGGGEASTTNDVTAASETVGTEEQVPPLEVLTPIKSGSGVRQQEQQQQEPWRPPSLLRPSNSRAGRHPTVAQWYNPDLSRDVLVDQKRAAISFFSCCAKCREPLSETIPPLLANQQQVGDICGTCQRQEEKEMPRVATLLAPPPVSMIQRPTLWRFHGPGDQVVRATWFLDTARHGFQPFDEEATAILEDAYLFLKWMSLRQAFQDDGSGSALLTVEVGCPDGADRLVQFSSNLTQATAIQKGHGAAMALFKRRVYRGAWLEYDKSPQERVIEQVTTIEESLLKAVKNNGALGETLVPDVSLRSALTPMPAKIKENRLVLFTGNDDQASLAVPAEQLNDRMGKYLDDEKTSGKIDHLVLVIHGIGEMLRSIDVFGLSLPNLSSIVDCCAWLRKNHAEVQDAHFTQMYPTSLAATGRVEYLPVEWHEAFSILSQRREQKLPDGTTASQDADRFGSTAAAARANQIMVNDISLRTIPQMRDFANDQLLDVLYFMSPEHHDIIIDVVANEMNVIVEKFRAMTGFTGRISFAGHSLGSIISWDILKHQVNRNRRRHGLPDVPSIGSLDSIGGCFSPATEKSYMYGYAPATPEAPEVTHHQPASSVESQSCAFPQLDFSVDNFFMLGSPVAVFLMIRDQRKPLSEDFYLPGCHRVFNIFHPYDPVAYRIEPCIDRRNADFEPTIMKHWNGGFRVHYQTKRLWRQLVDRTWNAQQTVVEAFESSMAGMGLIDSTVDALGDDDSSSEMSSADSRSNRVNTGALNQGRRIDYMLQEREIENANEYVAALAAHSSYWTEKDLSLFIARQIYLSTLENAAEAEDAESWEPVSSPDV